MCAWRKTPNTPKSLRQNLPTKDAFHTSLCWSLAGASACLPACLPARSLKTMTAGELARLNQKSLSTSPNVTQTSLFTTRGALWPAGRRGVAVAARLGSAAKFTAHSQEHRPRGAPSILDGDGSDADGSRRSAALPTLGPPDRAARLNVWLCFRCTYLIQRESKLSEAIIVPKQPLMTQILIEAFAATVCRGRIASEGYRSPSGGFSGVKVSDPFALLPQPPSCGQTPPQPGSGRPRRDVGN